MTSLNIPKIIKKATVGDILKVLEKYEPNSEEVVSQIAILQTSLNDPKSPVMENLAIYNMLRLCNGTE
ncbi:hypothetical protein FRC15_010772 [Serendipita sp. 397]|nr:hypothetical protein FRC15_010772 [Serendipita sp. 397]